MNPIVSNILFCVAGFYLGLYAAVLIQNHKISSYKKKQDDFFKLILNNFDSLTFLKRINSFAYFKFREWELLLNIEENTLHVFSKEICLASSQQEVTDKKITNSIINKIYQKWNNDIQDTVEFHDNKLSSNYFNQIVSEAVDRHIHKDTTDPDPMREFSVDDLLDKINQVGFNNLTEKEKEFLKKASE